MATMIKSNQSHERDILPNNVKPSHYDLFIHSIAFEGDFGYKGNVAIDITILDATSTIELNSIELNLVKATICGHESSTITYDQTRQRVLLTFQVEIQATKKATLLIEFLGSINSNMVGFYKSKYKPDKEPAKSVPSRDGQCLMFSTQFESCDARRAFPCFDEPNLKATFDVTIEAPADLTVLSNMDERSTKLTSSNLKTVLFNRTPVMSTYLLAWTIADLSYVETKTARKYDGRQLPVRVYSTPGLEQQGLFGAEFAAKVVDFYSDLFQIDYPLPKLDLVAVHEFSHNAMENWGLITYRTTAILYDPEHSDVKYLNKVAYVVAHELAHQWFGNLVTMDWWSELWLNEGFATWVGYYAVDHFFPKYEIWPMFLAQQFQTAQQLDGLSTSHAVEVTVRDAKEIEQVFDAISYLKGSSIIRMLVAHLGMADFMSGISTYLRLHAYSNAKTSELWAALSDASGKDVKEFMDPWIREIGYPVLTLTETSGELSVQQDRFLASGHATQIENSTLWWVPLAIKSNRAESIYTALKSREAKVAYEIESYYKINKDHIGFYRTNYPATRLAWLGSNRNKLSVEDRVGLVADVAAMAVAGRGTTQSLLDLLQNFQEEDNYAVWTQILTSVQYMRSIFADDAVLTRGLSAFTDKLISKSLDRVGWNVSPGENYLIGQLRSLLILTAGQINNASIIKEAHRQFSEYVKGNRKAINQNLRAAIFRIAVSNGTETEYEFVKHEYKQTSSFDLKEVCLSCMGKTEQIALVMDFLNFLFTDVAVQDIHFGTASLGSNEAARLALWGFIQSDWATISKSLSARPIIMDRFVKTGLSSFASHKIAAELSEFFADKDTRGYDRAVVQTIDNIKVNARYREREQTSILAWLRNNSYC